MYLLQIEECLFQRFIVLINIFVPNEDGKQIGNWFRIQINDD